MVYKSGQIFLPFCHNARVWRTDGLTDRILIARPRLHCMQRGKNLDRSFRRFVTIHACDRHTDGRTGKQTDRILLARPRLHSMQRGKN